MDQTVPDAPTSQPAKVAHDAQRVDSTGAQQNQLPLSERFKSFRSKHSRLVQLLAAGPSEGPNEAPPSSSNPWGFASRLKPLHHYLTDDCPKGTYMADLRASRAFLSPHAPEAMAEALHLEPPYQGLAGSLLAGPPSASHASNVDSLRTRLKQLVDGAWSQEALRHGVAHAAAGRHSEAINSYDRALQLDPANTDARVARGAALANRGSYQEAIADLEAAVQQQPSNSNAVSYLAAVTAAAEARLASSSGGEAAQAGEAEEGQAGGCGRSSPVLQQQRQEEGAEGVSPGQVQRPPEAVQGGWEPRAHKEKGHKSKSKSKRDKDKDREKDRGKGKERRKSGKSKSKKRRRDSDSDSE